MSGKKIIYIVVFTSITLLLTFSAWAKDAQKPKYSADVPEFLLTPDKVETEFLGDLEFFDGMPSESTVKKAYDFLDLSRGVEAFLNGMPAASIYAFLEGLKKAGLEPGDLGITENLLDARGLLLTAQSTTPYAFAEIDLKNGPVVVEIPGPVLGTLDDAFFRFVSDVGLTGPDQGKGGKYLFIGPDYEGDIPEGYFVAKSTTYRHWLLMRVFVKDGDLKASTKELKEGFRCYPLAQANKPPKQKVYDLSGKQFNTIHANDEHYYEELNAVIQYEPADAFNPELVGLFASIGIPVAFLLTFILMKAFGLSINGLTLFGLILVLGVVVDDAIVVLENIFRHIEKGKPLVKATLEGSRQVLAPVLASVSTTLAAFLPILILVGGVIGRYLADLPKVFVDLL